MLRMTLRLMCSSRSCGEWIHYRDIAIHADVVCACGACVHALVKRFSVCLSRVRVCAVCSHVLRARALLFDTLARAAFVCVIVVVVCVA